MRTHALRRALSPALLAAAFALVWLWPATAQAGTYDVSSCTSSSSVNGWSVYGSASFQEGIACPSNGDLVHRGFAVANAPNIGTIGSSGGGLRFKAPAGTSLVGIGAGLRVQRMDSSYWLGLIGASGQLLFGYWANDGSAVPASSYTPNAWFSLNHESDVHLEVGCSGLCDTSVTGSPGYRAWAQAFDPMTIRIEDTGAPTVSVTGGSLLGGSYATGTQAITYDASDASGIRVTRLYVDGTKVREDVRSCNFEQPVPCSNLTGGSYSVDTTALSDGAHNVKVETVDAAGNASAQSRTVTVDNHAPSAPAVSVTGGEGWRSSNGFSVSWAIPTGQVAPVVKARYQICRTDQPSDCQPAGVQNGSDITSLSGLTVPGEGDHTLTIWLEDAAGNASVTNASAPVHLRYDASAPARVSDLSVAGGAAWRPTNSFDLSWANPPGQVAPITSVRYRLCVDSGGDCSTGEQAGSAGISSLSGVRVPGPGAYTLTLWVGDDAGNSDPAAASAAVPLRFDDTDPGEATPETSNGWLNARDVVDGYDETIRDALSPPSGIAGFAVTTDGSEPGDVPNTGTDGVIHLTDLPDGAVTVKARAISNSGVASSHVGSGVLSVDTTAPDVNALGTPDGDAWQAGPVTVEVRGSDALSGMDQGHVSYSVDGGPVQTVAGGSARVTVADDGEHTVSYSGSDAAGNRADERSVTFRVDSGKPGAAQPGSSEGWVTSSGSYLEHVALGDDEALPLSGLAGFSVTTDGSTPDESADIGADGVLAINDLADGVTVVKARAVSGSGVASDAVGTGTIKVDRTAPGLVLERPDVGSPLTLVARASDSTSGVGTASLAYRSDDSQEWRRIPGELHDNVVRAKVDQVPAGTYAVRAVATDVAGNETVVTRFVDGGEATVTVESPVETVAGPTAPAPPSAPSAQAPPAKPVTRAAPVRCTATSKRSKHHKRSHRRKHPKAHHTACARPHHKGGEKHRRRHLGAKTHKPARRTAG
jgi:Big-like domain-containing protein